MGWVQFWSHHHLIDPPAFFMFQVGAHWLARVDHWRMLEIIRWVLWSLFIPFQ